MPLEGQRKAVCLEAGSQTQRHHWRRTDNSHQDSGTPASPCGERGPATEQKWFPEGGRGKKHPPGDPHSVYTRPRPRDRPRSPPLPDLRPWGWPRPICTRERPSNPRPRVPQPEQGAEWAAGGCHLTCFPPHVTWPAQDAIPHARRLGLGDRGTGSSKPRAGKTQHWV